MTYINTNLTFFQKLVIFLIFVGFLTASFFLAIALLPLFLVLGLYAWYRFYKFKKDIEEARQKAYGNFGENAEQFTRIQYFTQEDFGQNQQQNFNSQEQNFNNNSKQEDVYDISPENYTVEEKEKKN